MAAGRAPPGPIPASPRVFRQPAICSRASTRSPPGSEDTSPSLAHTPPLSTAPPTSPEPTPESPRHRMRSAADPRVPPAYALRPSGRQACHRARPSPRPTNGFFHHQRRSPPCPDHTPPAWPRSSLSHAQGAPAAIANIRHKSCSPHANRWQRCFRDPREKRNEVFITKISFVLYSPDTTGPKGQANPGPALQKKINRNWVMLGAVTAAVLIFALIRGSSAQGAIMMILSSANPPSCSTPCEAGGFRAAWDSAG